MASSFVVLVSSDDKSLFDRTKRVKVQEAKTVQEFHLEIAVVCNLNEDIFEITWYCADFEPGEWVDLDNLDIPSPVKIKLIRKNTSSRRSANNRCGDMVPNAAPSTASLTDFAATRESPPSISSPHPVLPATPIASPVGNPPIALPMASIVESPVRVEPEDDRVDLVVFQASPLVLKDNQGKTLVPEQLDLEGERQALTECLGGHNHHAPGLGGHKSVRVLFEIAQMEKLTTLLTRGTKILHFSGHGLTHEGLLVFEDNTGGGQIVNPMLLQTIATATSGGFHDPHTTFVGGSPARLQSPPLPAHNHTSPGSVQNQFCSAIPNHSPILSRPDQNQSQSQSQSQSPRQSKHTKLQLVVVCACYSEDAGRAFVKAGIPHIVAIQSREKV